MAATRQIAHFEVSSSAADEPLRAAGEKANGVVYPLTFNGALVGTVTVGRRAGDFVFSEVDFVFEMEIVPAQTAGRFVF